MKILKYSLAIIAILIAAVTLWIISLDEYYEEGDVSSYVESSQVLFQENGLNPESKFVETNGPVKRVHYYELGEGNPLILIHGGGGYASQWYSIMQALADTAHVFAVDRPGCGLTDSFMYNDVDISAHGAAFIDSFMKSLNIENATIVGHSMGGLFAVNYAHKNPGKVNSLVLIGHPAGGTKEIPPMISMMGVKRVNRAIRRMIGPPTVASTKEFHSMMLVTDTTHLSDAYWQNDVSAQRIPNTAKSFNSLLENCVSMSGFSEAHLIAPKLSSLNMPVHFIIGDIDPWDTIENAKDLVANMPNAKLSIIENASHLPWLDQPEQCAELITASIR